MQGELSSSSPLLPPLLTDANAHQCCTEMTGVDVGRESGLANTGAAAVMRKD